MSDTQFFKWTFPDENEDPHYEKLSNFFQLQENGIFGLLNTVGNIIIPPAGLSWNSGTKTLSWSGYFEIPLLASGFSLQVPYGPDGVNSSVSFLDGERLIVTVPFTSTGVVTANFAKSSGVQILSSNLFIVGFCRGSNFYGNFPQVYT